MRATYWWHDVFFGAISLSEYLIIDLQEQHHSAGAAAAASSFFRFHSAHLVSKEGVHSWYEKEPFSRQAASEPY